MTSDQIREAFLHFFEEKGHKVISSSSLIPQDDLTLLLTTAGMVQFKPYFLGEAVPPRPRLASCQKCFRTTDVSSVGDPCHLTFFEMLGNFSIGDYFKREAITWAWEFVTQRLGLPQERLWATIFLDDDESFGYWQEVGVPADKILRFGEKDNFWGPAGESGPCGPCSELHYDLGEGTGCGKSTCAPGCECGRFFEIWNLVFTQYYQDQDGHRIPLPKPNIDTGMGLERTAAVMQGKLSVYDTDLFIPLLEGISRSAGKMYGAGEATDHAMRVIAEHSRGITFLIADGVVPSNEGRGYVLRRLLRRTALFGRKLGLRQPFLSQIAEAVIASMGHIYPELIASRNFILSIIGLEEERFIATLDTGLDLLDSIIAEVRGDNRGVIPGSKAFMLYDTYGFPVELTAEVASENGLSVDMEGFELEMEHQRERARAAQRFGLGERNTMLDYASIPLPATGFVGYEADSCQSKVISLVVDGKPERAALEGQMVEVALDRTAFYAEMGGQMADTGKIVGEQGTIMVADALWARPDLIVHRGQVMGGGIFLDEEVKVQIDTKRRQDIARNHTATHLLQAALREVLGSHVYQRGSLVAPERLRFDFSHLAAVTAEELARVQHIVNEKIRQDLPVRSKVVPHAQAIAEGAIALFGEKYGEEVRVIEIGEPVLSAELCGGTHTRSTGEIGFLQICLDSAGWPQIRRIEAVTGRGAETFIERHLSILEGVARELGGTPGEVQSKLSALTAELDGERKRSLSLERALSRRVAESLLGRVESIDGVSMLAARVNASSMPALREMGDLLRERLKSGVVVLGAVYNDKPNFLAVVTPDLVARGFHAGEIAREVAKITGGGGGGRAELAQAGGKDKDRLDEALKLVKKLVQRR